MRKYSSLDDDSYWKIQPWVEHQRPSRWIIDLAMQKTLALARPGRGAHESRAMRNFSDSLELMIFLANLVGSEHIERFIPVADAENERPCEAGAERRSRARMRPRIDAAVTATATREMPKFLAAEARTARPPARAQVARTERKARDRPNRPRSRPPSRRQSSPRSAAGKPAKSRPPRRPAAARHR